MQRWGYHRNGKRRYRCPHCKVTGTKTRQDIVIKAHQALYYRWLLSKLTLTEFGEKYGVDRRTLDRWFLPYRDLEIAADVVEAREVVLLVDGYYVRYAATVLISQTTKNEVMGWLFTYAENYSTWSQFFNSLSFFPAAIVGDGQRGMLKAAKERWPGVIIQRCQFHVIHHVNLLLTKHPETQAAQDFKVLVNRISRVKSETDYQVWLVDYRQWYQEHQTFLKTKTFHSQRTPTGRRKWHYTHGHLHASFSHVKNALPYLFQYLKYPEIPNTSNRIEGGINAQLQRLIDRHRGTTIIQQRHLIATYLKQKQPKNPTQNVT